MFKRKVSKNEQGKFSPNFTNMHMIPGYCNHMSQALKDHTRARITQKTVNQYQHIQLT